MRNIKLTIQYDGTNYHGFQIQSIDKEPTIQGILEQKLTQITKEPIKIIGAGRTDAGVHAKGQVVNFYTNCQIPIERFVRAVNSVLPLDIVSTVAEEATEDFHACYSATGKQYTYTLYYSKIPPLFERDYTLFIPYKLDLSLMQQAANHLLGKHDFTSFRSSGSSVISSVRTLNKLDIIDESPIIKMTFQADGFLYNMVRIITGTLLQVGRGRITPNQVKQILEARNRKQAGPTALAKGLCLEQVIY